MAKILGLTAVMIYARDREKMAQWYAKHLGIETRSAAGAGYNNGEIPAVGAGGVVYFAFLKPRDDAAAGERSTMVNYKVADLDAFMEEMKREGIAIERTMDEPYGRFAYLRDPEGNPIEVWQERT